MSWQLRIMLPWIRALECMYSLELVGFLGRDILLSLWVELLSHIATLFSVFWGNSIPFSIVIASIYFPINKLGEFPYPHILAKIFISVLFDDSHCDMCEFWFPLTWWFSLTWWFQMMSIFFMCFLAISIFSLEKCLRSSAHFSIGFVFLLLSRMSYLYIVEINPLSHHLQVFSPSLQVYWLSQTLDFPVSPFACTYSHGTTNENPNCDATTSTNSPSTNPAKEVIIELTKYK